MSSLWMDVDTAVTVPVNVNPLVDAATAKVVDEGVVYNEAGLDLVWHFVTTAGVVTATDITPTTGANQDWSHTKAGMYKIEIPATLGGDDIANTEEGFGYFTGNTTANLPWRGPTIGFRAAALNNALIDGGDILDVNVTQWLGTAPVALSSQRVQVDVQAIEGFTAASMVLGWWLAEGVVPIADSGTTTTLIDATLTQADDYWNGALLVFRSGTNTGRTAIITDFDAGTDTLTFAPAMPDAVTTEGYILVPGLGHADIAAISHDPDAADKLKAQFNGNGLIGDTFPLRQDQGASISGGLAVKSNMTSVTVIQGSQQDLANTNASNNTRWTGDDDGSGAEFIFLCTPADITAEPGDLHFEGYYDEPVGNTNGATVEVYNFQSAAWESHIALTNSSQDETHDVSLTHAHGAPGSGTLETVAYTISDVLIKFRQDTQETGNACLLIDRMYVGFISGAVTASEIVDEWETQSQTDPTGFHVNVLEVNGTGQTANDNGADINAILLDTGTDGVVIVNGGITAAKIADGAIDNATFAADVGTTAYASNHIALAADKALVQQNLDHLAKAGDATLTNIVADNTIFAHIMAIGADISDFVSSTDSLEGLAAGIAGISGGLAGSGAISWELEIKDDAGQTLDGVEVWVSTDNPAVDIVAGTLITDAFGLVTFMLDAGTYYVWRQRTNYNFTNPLTTVVS